MDAIVIVVVTLPAARVSAFLRITETGFTVVVHPDASVVIAPVVLVTISFCFAQYFD